ncbi:sigma-70 family RNA polymerase sigma factor [Shewanella loihica]|uniref:RNA polymerase, sigma-24 subunit, ECF subfamily n=1 Tax=Shewanella loihica (strain ATCC BAA-1088 / PV-4) TaxID=323850 RepID=A3QCZ5_SHELP|nr:sigma-70 family RNA polymerase sigma factor [Shewanella loihica]ABO23343.1 RNA polymerase, sigma-24 subunit, ECF subfamily [Shewanella loihica PV-4]
MQTFVSAGAPDKGSANIKTQPETQVPAELSTWLVRVADARDKQAFTRLFQFFAPKIKRFGIKQLGNEAQAHELVQETMSNVWRKAHLYDGDKGAATTWVYTVMRNAAFDMLRRVKAKAEMNLGDDIWPLEQAQVQSEEEPLHFADHLMEKQMLAYVDSLPEAQRAVVKGVYYQELSQEQLAQQFGVPIGTIKSRLRLALAKLKQQMGDQQHD